MWRWCGNGAPNGASEKLGTRSRVSSSRSPASQSSAQGTSGKKGGAPSSQELPSSQLPPEQSPFFSGRHTAAVSPSPPTRGAVRERDGHASLRLRPENRRSQPCQASGCRQPLTWHARESTTVLPQRYAQPRSSRRDLPNTGPVYDGTTASPPLAGRNLTNKHHMKDCICSPKP